MTTIVERKWTTLEGDMVKGALRKFSLEEDSCMEFLSGSDRVEIVQALGRMVRMGAPGSLMQSDVDRILQNLNTKDGELAISYATYFWQLNSSMVSSGYEWLIRWPLYLGREVVSKAAGIATDAHARWAKVVRVAQQDALDDNLYKTVFTPDELNAQEVDRYQGGTSQFARLTNRRQQLFEQFKARVNASDFDLATATFEDLLKRARTEHDLILQYVWAYASATKVAVGEEKAQQALAWTLQSSPSYQAGMALLKLLTPAQIAGALAEHLRGHFSGAERRGAVQIVEEEDCFRLILAPCGSGGTMRGLGCNDVLLNFATPVPATFGKENVPAYCSHCAQNEIRTADLLGYPAWVADFDHDHKKPCGWRIYKDPRKIPDEYFRRIGAVRPQK